VPARRLTDFDGPWLGQYILGGEDGHTPIPCYSLHEWGVWLETAGDKRIVAWTGNAKKYVSTVFLGLDHRHWGNGPPILFESMAFKHEGRMTDFGFGNGPEPVPETLDEQRYSSWDDAETGHKAMVRKYLVNAKTRAGAADGERR
jgi:hypothetical protein